MGCFTCGVLGNPIPESAEICEYELYCCPGLGISWEFNPGLLSTLACLAIERCHVPKIMVRMRRCESIQQLGRDEYEARFIQK